MSKIYTTGGDLGKTSLLSGERVWKCSNRVRTYGAIDEAVSSLGVVHSHLVDQNYGEDFISSIAKYIQILWNCGADFANDTTKYSFLVSSSDVEFIEQEIDRYNNDLQPLTKFILPVGSLACTYLHVARTKVRASECLASELLKDGNLVNNHAYIALNRLSDLFFTLARWMDRD